MDTSETFIKMCDCEEVQKGQYKYVPTYNPSVFVHPSKHHITNSSHFEGTEIPNGYIWLPYQHQLQEMVGDYAKVEGIMSDYGYLMNEYWEYLGVDETYWEDFTSMEQLWLAFVMKEKWNKVWNGEEWIPNRM